ncbi:hypothetical protein OOT00_13905 [Desulfobotulus sp. H1]|uniref:DUF4230 domain-containing protein n=1 Tax=Desulfobotulus pelophilus TaxID=2823377 RepID=A0ABT3NC97_9BACT|nr:hypothetical protein [Desulfobotulus pelophilus]MCW7755079.1 hypothetical protein [Desulfobotulus pelophilus]
MKHIVSIHLIVILFSAVSAFFLFYEKPSVSDPFIVINGKKISHDVYEKARKHKPYYLSDRAFMEQFIETELLVQSAMKKKLHQNDAFAVTVKNFYEKNLVQLLMEIKYEEFASIQIPDPILSSFMASADKEVLITSPDNPAISPAAQPFLFLPSHLQYRILNSPERKVQQEDPDGNHSLLYTLTDSKAEMTKGLHQQDLFMKMEDMKNRQLWDAWIDDLKARASIIISE